MARIRCDFRSDVLGLSTSMTVLLPDRPPAGDGHPTLYLLHGRSDDDTAWTRHTAIEDYVEPLGLAVVMPQVHLSFYTDEAVGLPFWTFLSEELPARSAGYFRLSARPEETFVAGLSMGGYGALKWALRQPGRFAAAASLSGAVGVAQWHHPDQGGEDQDGLRRLFGEVPAAGTDEDLMHLARTADPATVPPLYLCCGTEDGLYGDNVEFRDACRAAGLPTTVDFGPGAHTWPYWDRKIQDVLAWLPVSKKD
jgi:putative tributyrin esterase